MGSGNEFTKFLVERSARKHGVDPGIVNAMAQQESGFNPKARSGADARGPLQVIPNTGKRFVSPDEYNTVKGQIDAGVKYFKFLKDRYGNDEQAVAGYFAGEGAVDKAIKRGKRLPNSYDPYSKISAPDHVQRVMGNLGDSGPSGEFTDFLNSKQTGSGQVQSTDQVSQPSSQPSIKSKPIDMRHAKNALSLALNPVVLAPGFEATTQPTPQPVRQPARKQTQQVQRPVKPRLQPNRPLTGIDAAEVMQMALTPGLIQRQIHTTPEGLMQAPPPGMTTLRERQLAGNSPAQIAEIKRYEAKAARDLEQRRKEFRVGSKQIGPDWFPYRIRALDPDKDPYGGTMESLLMDNPLTRTLQSASGAIGDVFYGVGVPVGAALGIEANKEYAPEFTMSKLIENAGNTFYTGQPSHMTPAGEISKIGVESAGIDPESTAGQLLIGTGAALGDPLTFTPTLRSAVKSGKLSPLPKQGTPGWAERMRSVADEATRARINQNLTPGAVERMKAARGAETPETIANRERYFEQIEQTPEQLAYVRSRDDAKMQQSIQSKLASKQPLAPDETAYIAARDDKLMREGIAKRIEQGKPLNPKQRAYVKAQSQTPMEAYRGTGTETPMEVRRASSDEGVIQTPVDQSVAQTSTVEAQAPKLQHEKFGEVVKDPDQSGVTAGKIRVEDADGNAHIIQNPRTTGNRSATFVRQAAEPSTPETVSAASQDSPQRYTLQPLVSDAEFAELQALNRQQPSLQSQFDEANAELTSMYARNRRGQKVNPADLKAQQSKVSDLARQVREQRAGQVAEPSPMAEKPTQGQQASAQAIPEQAADFNLQPAALETPKGEHGKLIQGLFKSPDVDSGKPAFFAEPSVRTALGLDPMPDFKDKASYNAALKQAKDKLASAVGVERTSQITPEQLRAWADQNGLSADAMGALESARTGYASAQAGKAELQARVEAAKEKKNPNLATSDADLITRKQVNEVYVQANKAKVNAQAEVAQLFGEGVRVEELNRGSASKMIRHLKARQAQSRPQPTPSGRFKVDPQKDTLLGAIAKIGIDPRTQEGRDLARYLSSREGGRIGSLRKAGTGRGEARDIDYLMTRLEEEGWTFEDKNALFEAVRREQAGKPVYSSQRSFDSMLDDELNAAAKGDITPDDRTEAQIIADAYKNQDFVNAYSRLFDGDVTDADIQTFRQIARYERNFSDKLIEDAIANARANAADSGSVTADVPATGGRTQTVEGSQTRQPAQDVEVVFANPRLDDEAVKDIGRTRVIDDSGEPRRVYHGTTRSFDDFDASTADPDSLYGPGIYFTEDAATASGYAGVKEAANVRPAYLSINNTFDIDGRYTRTDLQHILDALPDDARAIADEVLTAKGNTVRGWDVNFAVRDGLKFTRQSERFHDVMRAAGYDGITHIGGVVSGNKSHRVWIAFDAEQVKPVFASEGGAYRDAVLKRLKGKIKDAIGEERGSFSLKPSQREPIVNDLIKLAKLYVKQGAPGYIKYTREIQSKLGNGYQAARPHLRAAWQAAKQEADKGEGSTAKAGKGIVKAEPAVPSRDSVWETLSAVRKAGMLSSFKTHARNITGNAAYQVFDEVSRVPAAVGDFIASAATKRRTITGPNPSAMLDSVATAFTKGGKEALEIMKQGQTAEQAAKLQLPRELNSGSKIIDTAANTVFRLMGATDRVFYNGALRRNLLDRARAQALTEVRAGKLERGEIGKRTKALANNPSEELKANAEHDALVATFNNNNKLSDAIQSVRGGLSPAANFAIDLVMPFDRTPTNIMARVLESSPLGFGKNAKQLARALVNKGMSAEEQRAFAQTFGRATTGTGILTLGFILAEKGLMTGFYDDDVSKRAENRKDKEAGRQSGSIKIGDKWVQVQTLAPLGSLLVMGANLHKEWKENAAKAQSDKLGSAVGSATSTFGRAVMEQPLLRGSKDIVEAVKSEAKLSDRAGYITGSFVPSIISDTAMAVDPKARKGFGFIPEIQKRVPFWRNQLPEDVGVQHNRLWSVDPFRTTTEKRPARR